MTQTAVVKEILPGGRAAVERYWDELADAYLGSTLARLAAERGVEGCWEYWREALAAESSDARLEYDPRADVFTIDMRHCPSKGRLLDRQAADGFAPYSGYCDHCPHMYRRVLEPMGIAFDMDMSECDRARCRIRIYRRR